MSLIKRVCPLCGADDHSTLVVLKERHFTKNNPSYRLDRIHELGLDPDQDYPIISCRRCSMVYSLYHLDDRGEALVYNRIIDKDRSKAKILTTRRRMADLERWMNLLSLDVGQRSGKLDLKILDYGSGWGTMLLTAKGPGVTAIGFEVAGHKAQWARDNGITVYGSMDEVYAKAPFDILIATSVIEHMRDPRRIIKDMTRLLRPGGYAYFTCVIWNITTLRPWKMIRKRIEKGLPIPKEVNPWEHLNYFTHAAFLKMLKECGLTPLRVPGGWVGGNIMRDFVKILSKRSLSFILPNIWTSGYYQLKK